MKKVLLTGAAGFLGSRVADSLLRQGIDDLRLHVRQGLPTHLLEALRSAHPRARIECCAANLMSRAELPALLDGVECLVHAAAGMRGHPADMFANTVLGTRNVLEAAAQAGVRRIVLISSFSVYRTSGLRTGALLDESVPIEPVGADKGPYAYAKTRQEQLVQEFKQRLGFETVILRPGVIYGPGGGAFSSRVGIRAMGMFFSLGGSALLPLTYVENCADAVACATLKAQDSSVFNVVDAQLPTCRAYLAAYRREVRALRTLPVPYPALLLGSRWLAAYHKRSNGQLPALFTPYVVRSMYRPLRYSNAALAAIGWRQRVPTAEALARSFQAWRAQPA